MVPPTVLIGRLNVLFALIEWYIPEPGSVPLALVGEDGVIIMVEPEGVIMLDGPLRNVPLADWDRAAALVATMKWDSFQPALRYTSRSSVCCHMLYRS